MSSDSFSVDLVTQDLSELQLSRTGKSSVVVREHLSPPTNGHVVAQMFLNSVVLPSLQGSLKRHKSRCAALVGETAPKVSRGGEVLFENMEIARQHEELSQQVQDLTDEYERFVHMLQSISKHLLHHTTAPIPRMTNIDAAEESRPTSVFNPLLEDGFFLLKTSRGKKAWAVSPLPTNLCLHATDLVFTSSTSPIKKSKSLICTTFGAPAAHALGFSTGGLRSTILNLEQKILHGSQPGRAHCSPKAHLEVMRLRFKSKARESIVVAQAMGAIVSASVEFLTRCLQEKASDVWKQITTIGLLVHSVSLLSTSGHEKAMIDDFAGAFESLNVALRLLPMPLGAAPSSDGTLLKVVRVQPMARMFAGDVTSSASFKSGRGSSLGSVRIVLQVNSSETYDWALKELGGNAPTPEIHITPVLFNLGK